MMESIEDTILQKREEAGLMLGMKLHQYEKTKAVVIGIPKSGVCVAAVIAEYLSLPLEVMPCQRIKHPADDSKNLGSVGLTEVVLHDNIDDVPWDFVTHQITMLRNANAHEQKFYHKNKEPLILTNRTVILVDDLLKSSEVMLACVHEIKKKSPLKIIVAVPIASAQAARVVGAEVDETLFLKTEQDIGRSVEYFVDQRISKERVKELLYAHKRLN